MTKHFFGDLSHLLVLKGDSEGKNTELSNSSKMLQPYAIKNPANKSAGFLVLGMHISTISHPSPSSVFTTSKPCSTLPLILFSISCASSGLSASICFTLSRPCPTLVPS